MLVGDAFITRMGRMDLVLHWRLGDVRDLLEAPDVVVVLVLQLPLHNQRHALLVSE